ncbi:hypothetical protein [Streptomyces camelliae]|uniref:Uncharacterized protein n=1 Tax=Streptomyces camelliae TaxID=3004093 RepID=A0ABY7PGB1_9ACTN|nr:hypothetical protein [Streptomyces sp. HUAS 2-6]WBO67323.1 hypothetical protein O1G22_33185 [Streptomyces sp. HUAS 2-6]
MPTPALAAALADIETVFNGFASPHETGCGRCHLPEETAYLRTPYVRVPLGVVDMHGRWPTAPWRASAGGGTA